LLLYCVYMLLPRATIIGVNGILLLIMLILAVMLLNAGARFTWHIGERDKFIKYSEIIMRLIVVMITIGLLAAVFNLLVA
jgi:hypothetical protein